MCSNRRSKSDLTVSPGVLTLPWSHVAPKNAGAHVQVKPVSVVAHVPSLRHGTLAQKSMAKKKREPEATRWKNKLSLFRSTQRFIDLGDSC